MAGALQKEGVGFTECQPNPQIPLRSRFWGRMAHKSPMTVRISCNHGPLSICSPPGGWIGQNKSPNLFLFFATKMVFPNIKKNPGTQVVSLYKLFNSPTRDWGLSSFCQVLDSWAAFFESKTALRMVAYIPHEPNKQARHVPFQHQAHVEMTTQR